MSVPPLSTSEHDNVHGDVLLHVTAADLRAMLRAYPLAHAAARAMTEALAAAGIGPDRASVTATLTNHNQPAVLITLADPADYATVRRCLWQGRRLCLHDAGGGGPPALRRAA